jgi:uncharacterized membrane protein YsdA (DUF1294 family)
LCFSNGPASKAPRSDRPQRRGAARPQQSPVPPFALILLVWHAAASLVAVAAYALDKRAAVRGAWRIPEARLHTLSLLGGWPGALLAMRLFKHKRRKAAFVRVFWLTVVVHLAVLALLVRLMR